MPPKIDERDIIFARMACKPGTDVYNQYYTRCPHNKDYDDRMRQRPPLGGAGTPVYNPLGAAAADGVFELLADMKPLYDGPAAERKLDGSARVFTKWLKGLALEAGAAAQGVVSLKPEHYYSHRGRQGVHYGQPVGDFLPYGLLLAVPMNPDLIHKAPKTPAMVATVMGYLEGAKIALALAYSVRQAGYRCRAHIDGQYLMPLHYLVPESGIGAIGRHGLLITKDHGPCVRLAAIDTDMPLEADGPDLEYKADLEAFCRLCGLCAAACPAIPKDGWPGRTTEANVCYERWRRFGSDCGVCISACPFTGGRIDRQRLRTEEGRQALWAEISQNPKRPYDAAPLTWCPDDLY